MQVKNPMCIVFGIICLLCFIISVIKGRDLFTIVLCLFATTMEFIAGIGGKE